MHANHIPFSGINECTLSVVEEELTEYVLKYARLDEFGRRAVQAIIREEEARCRSEETLHPAKVFSGWIRISRTEVTD